MVFECYGARNRRLPPLGGNIRGLGWVHTQFARRECLPRHTFRGRAHLNTSAARFKFTDQTPTVLVFGNGILDGISSRGRIGFIAALFGFRNGIVQFLVAFARFNQQVADILDSSLGNIDADFGSVAGNVRGFVDGTAGSGSQKREKLVHDRREDIRDIFE